MSPVVHPRLVAIDLPGGPAFVEELTRIWDCGDAALPLDQRLPPSARRSLASELGVGERVEPGDALVVATSGSTGSPKGVVLSHDALQAHAALVHGRLGVNPGSDRWIACLPLAHMGGLGVVVRALLTGTSLTVLPRFEPNELDGTLISLVPTALDRLDPALISAFKWIVLGGSGDATKRPENVVHTYGMTESGGGIVYDGFPLDGVEMRVVDDVIQLRSPTLLRCYRDGNDPKTPDGWYPTGDIGSIDDEGRLLVAGRRDHLIITGGENVWPERVETILRDAPGVADVAITGRDDDKWGQRIIAHVVPIDRTNPPELDDLRTAVECTMGSYAAPRELVLIDQIPRTALGKIRRGSLT